MAREFPSFAVPRGVRALVLAQVGAGLTILALWGCGGTGVTTDANAGAGGSASGGGGTDGDSSGGAASGGAATGGAASGGAAAGGTSSGGSGTGGVADIVNACPGVPSGPGVYPPCRTQADCNVGQCQANAPSGDICGACFPPAEDCTLDTDCSEGNVCVTGPEMPCQCMGPGKVCEPACTSDSCDLGLACREDGHCSIASCDEDGFVCPESTLCAPERPGNPQGCAPSSCNGDGYTCPEGTICDASRTGDAHQCAPARCESEGYVCPEDSVCEPGTPTSDGHGCRRLRCDEGFECPVNQDCNVESTTSTRCVQRACTADTDCECGACVMGLCSERLYMCVTLPG